MTVDYKISIVGPIPSDHIITYNNDVIERYGCITYPVIALSKLFGRSARITPVSHVRKKDQQTIKMILKGHPGVELLRINADLDMGDVIRLQYINKRRCLEKQYGFMNPILPDDVKHLLDSDVFVFLPVTDYEVPLEVLEFVKTYSKAEIIFDAHGPTTAMSSLGDRVRKFWISRDLWLPYIDVLTMNLEEAKCSWFSHEYTLEQLEDSEDISMEDLRKLAQHCLDKGVKALYVTLEDQGCAVYFMQDGSLHEEIVATLKVESALDTTGSGDAFVGGLTYGLLKTKDYIKAAQYANILRAQRLGGFSYDVFSTPDELEQTIKEFYS